MSRPSRRAALSVSSSASTTIRPPTTHRPPANRSTTDTSALRQHGLATRSRLNSSFTTAVNAMPDILPPGPTQTADPVTGPQSGRPRPRDPHARGCRGSGVKGTGRARRRGGGVDRCRLGDRRRRPLRLEGRPRKRATPVTIAQRLNWVLWRLRRLRLVLLVLRVVLDRCLGGLLHRMTPALAQLVVRFRARAASAVLVIDRAEHPVRGMESHRVVFLDPL